MEFATVFVGVLAVAGFGLSLWEALLGIIIGSGIGAVTQGLLSQDGPVYGVPQMVIEPDSASATGATRCPPA